MNRGRAIATTGSSIRLLYERSQTTTMAKRTESGSQLRIAIALGGGPEICQEQHHVPRLCGHPRFLA